MRPATATHASSVSRAPPRSLTLSLPPANNMSSSASPISPDSTDAPPSRAMLAWAMRRLGHDGLAERQTPAIELDQLPAADIVRKRHLDRLIDATGAARQRALELLRPVGGEDEQDIGILLQPIHLVEQSVEQRFLARPHLVAIAPNQIGVLDYDHRRLQKSGQIHVMGQQFDLRCRDDQGGVTGQVAREIADGMGLAGAGRAVKQDALAGRLSQDA